MPNAVRKASSAAHANHPERNRILAALPDAELARLAPLLHPVAFKKGTVLYHAGDRVTHCYFPVSGILSILSATESGALMEVAMIGSEGLAGIAALLPVNAIPFEVIAQSDARVLQITAADLQAEFRQGGALQTQLLGYLFALLRQTAQSAACNGLHSVKQRLCRWLLIACDKTNCQNFPLTQEFIALMLGSTRTNVTMTLRGLETAGLINYKRGRIEILDRRALERTACECYRVIKKEVDNSYL